MPTSPARPTAPVPAGWRRSTARRCATPPPPSPPARPSAPCRRPRPPCGRVDCRAPRRRPSPTRPPPIPAAEERLLEAATSRSLHGLRSLANQVKAAAAGDDTTRDRRARSQRHLRSHIGAEGAFEGDFSGPADEGAVFLRALKLYAEEAFRAARKAGERPSFEALQWDALVEMARAALGERATATVGGSATKIIVRVDYDALVRGHTTAGETCDIAGLGPVPVTAVRRLLADPDSFLAVVLTRAQQVMSAVHLGRRPNALQRTVLEWLHATCAVDDCDNTILEWDHRIDWTTTHHTTLAELDGLCGHHHGLKTDHNWRLEAGTGKRPLRPPGHPNHPGHPPAPRGRRRSRPAARDPDDPHQPGGP